MSVECPFACLSHQTPPDIQQLEDAKEGQGSLKTQGQLLTLWGWWSRKASWRHDFRWVLENE